MTDDQVAALMAYAESVNRAVCALDTVITAMVVRFDAELAELRDALVDLDHKLGAHVYHHEVQTEGAELRRLREEM